MKKQLFTLSLLSVIALGLGACGGKSSDADKTKNESATGKAVKNEAVKKDSSSTQAMEESPAVKHFHHYEEDFQKLTLGLRGVIRTVDLGDDMKYVKSIEKGKLVKETDESLFYEARLSTDETVTVEYHFRDGSVDGMNLKVLMGTNEELITMMGEFTDFYTQKFGFPFVTDDGNEIWKPKDDTTHEIDIIDQSESGKNILEISIK